MSAVPLGKGRQLAMERLRTVMRAEFGNEILAAFKGSSYPTLPCTAPQEQAYVISEPHDPGDVPDGFGEVVYIWKNPSRRAIERRTGTATTSASWTEFQVSVVYLFRYAMGPPQLDESGLTLTRKTETALRAELYSEAMLNTVLKYATSAEPIHRVEYVADDAFAYLADERGGSTGIIGVASCQFTIKQKVSVHERRRLPGLI